MNKPIYCIIHHNKEKGSISALGITREMLMTKSVIMEHSRSNYKELKFNWEDAIVYVSEDGMCKYSIQIVSDFDKYKDYPGE